MEKLKMLMIAVSISMVLSVSGNCGEFAVDFDAEGARRVSFMETWQSTDRNAVAVPQVEAVVAEATFSTKPQFFSLGVEGARELRKNAASISGVSESFIRALGEQGAIVLYNDTAALVVAPAGKTLYVKGESDSRELLKSLAEFGRISGKSDVRNPGMVYRCFKVIDTFMKWVNNAWVAYEVSRQVCEWQYDGTPAPDTGNPGGSGGTYNSSQGGDSNYDVNRHLR